MSEQSDTSVLGAIRQRLLLTVAQADALGEFERLLNTATCGQYRLDLNETDPPTFEIRMRGYHFGFARFNDNGSVVLI